MIWISFDEIRLLLGSVSWNRVPIIGRNSRDATSVITGQRIKTACLPLLRAAVCNALSFWMTIECLWFFSYRETDIQINSVFTLCCTWRYTDLHRGLNYNQCRDVLIQADQTKNYENFMYSGELVLFFLFVRLWFSQVSRFLITTF